MVSIVSQEKREFCRSMKNIIKLYIFPSYLLNFTLEFRPIQQADNQLGIIVNGVFSISLKYKSKSKFSMELAAWNMLIKRFTVTPFQFDHKQLLSPKHFHS
jgi:hypothetical protein